MYLLSKEFLTKPIWNTRNSKEEPTGGEGCLLISIKKTLQDLNTIEMNHLKKTKLIRIFEKREKRRILTPKSPLEYEKEL